MGIPMGRVCILRGPRSYKPKRAAGGWDALLSGCQGPGQGRQHLCVDQRRCPSSVRSTQPCELPRTSHPTPCAHDLCTKLRSLCCVCVQWVFVQHICNYAGVNAV